MTATPAPAQETPVRDLGVELEWGPVFTARPIHTGPDGRHTDAAGREYLATVINGELTFAPVETEWTTVPAVVQSDQSWALTWGGLRVAPAVVKALVVPVLLTRDGDLLLDTDEGLFWPEPVPTGLAPAALTGQGQVSPGQILDAIHAAAIAEGLTPETTTLTAGSHEVNVHCGIPRPTLDQGTAVLTRLGVARADVTVDAAPGYPWSSVSAHVPVLGVRVDLFIEAVPDSDQATDTDTDAGGTP